MNEKIKIVPIRIVDGEDQSEQDVIFPR